MFEFQNKTVNERSKGRRFVRRALAVGFLAATSALTIAGWAHISGNWDDMKDMMYLTSAAGQDDRCDLQDSLDAQVDMREHTANIEGGLTPELAKVMGDTVGIGQERVTKLLTTKLFEMNYDCGTPEASSSRATKGLIFLTAAGSMAVGVGGTAMWSNLGSRRDQLDDAFTEEFEGIDEPL